MKFIVKRNQWLRGRDPGLSFLLRRRDNKMCCLGFLAKACGAKDQEIRDKSSPALALEVNWPESLKPIIDILHTTNSEICNSIIETNDDERISDSQREDKLQSLFETIGIDVKFEDE